LLIQTKLMKGHAMKELNPLIREADKLFNAVDHALELSIDEASSDGLIAQLARAHIAAIKLERLTRVIDVEVNHAPVKPAELPPLQKQLRPTEDGHVERPGISKWKKSPKDFQCPTCHAEPGTSCFRMTMQGRHGVVTNERRSDKDHNVHAKRQALSKAHNDKVKAKYDREHFDAS